MPLPITETTVISLHENTNDEPAPAAPTAPTPKASRGKSPTESSRSPAPKLLCRHRVRNGAYCRLPASDPKTGLCFRHASLRLQEVDSGDLSEALVCGIKDFHSAADINHVLGELYKLLAANKISPRRGAVMAYTCSLLLRTLPAIEHELHLPSQDVQEDQDATTIVMDIPCAVARRAQVAQAAHSISDNQCLKDPERAMVNRIAARGVASQVAPDGYTSILEQPK